MPVSFPQVFALKFCGYPCETTINQTYLISHTRPQLIGRNDTYGHRVDLVLKSLKSRIGLFNETKNDWHILSSELATINHACTDSRIFSLVNICFHLLIHQVSNSAYKTWKCVDLLMFTLTMIQLQILHSMFIVNFILFIFRYV